MAHTIMPWKKTARFCVTSAKIMSRFSIAQLTNMNVRVFSRTYKFGMFTSLYI
ncbi:unnamed protein product [Spodoptera exigua]|nr:unnamed protein product [Spodoptera exigua]